MPPLSPSVSTGTITLNSGATSQPPDKVFNAIPVMFTGSGVVTKIELVLSIQNMTFAVEIPQFTTGGSSTTAQVHVTRIDSNNNWNVALPIAVQVTFGAGLGSPSSKRITTYKRRLVRTLKKIKKKAAKARATTAQRSPASKPKRKSAPEAKARPTAARTTTRPKTSK
jgi:hypothetical protein